MFSLKQERVGGPMPLPLMSLPEKFRHGLLTVPLAGQETSQNRFFG